jgi:ABC-2 type transport system ATP-binding protein
MSLRCRTLRRGGPRYRAPVRVLPVGATQAVELPISAPRPLHGVPDAVVIDGASVKFPDQLAVDKISLTVQSGTILGLIGPSGAGKTTTIRLLTGTLEPTSGSVTVLGENPRSFRRRTRQQIGYMPQALTLFPDLTCKENVDFNASLFGMLFRSRRRRTREALELVDLWDVRGRRASRLSGGMQRRLELACALVHDPTLLFLDEPTAGLDPLLRERVWHELHRLRRDGHTIVVTTQYLNEAEACDYVGLIAEGRLIALATPNDLRRLAMGGDVLDVETAGLFDADVLKDLPVVRDVRQLGPRRMRITVDDVGAATPDVVAAVEDHGGEVASAREERPSFDEVFTRLVEREQARGQADERREGQPDRSDEATG